jgi:predicted nucleic acid-binding protein
MKSITIHNLDDEVDALIREKSIRIELKQKGTPIPLNDVWIASHCIETGSVLISFDKHFKNVPGLRTWDY